MLSIPILLGTKAVWRGEMRDGSKGLSLFTITFVTTLYVVLHKLMGLKEAR